MSIQLNQKATGCCLTKATERMNGHMMRNLYLFLEIIPSEDMDISPNSKVSIVVKDKDGKITLMDDSDNLGKEYKLRADYPMFLKFEFAFFEEEWKALLQGETVLLTFNEDRFDISQVPSELLKNEGNK